MTNTVKRGTDTRDRITYVYRGQIEVGTGEPGYKWVPGYSESMPDGSVPYPLMCQRDCRHDAKVRGAVAIFADQGGVQWLIP